jgi:hypothetical protein
MIESINFSTSASSGDDGPATLLGNKGQSFQADVEGIAEASIGRTEEQLGEVSIWKTGNFGDVFDVDCGMSRIMNDPGLPKDM